MDTVMSFAYHTLEQGLEDGEKVHQSNNCDKFAFKKTELQKKSLGSESIVFFI